MEIFILSLFFFFFFVVCFFLLHCRFFVFVLLNLVYDSISIYFSPLRLCLYTSSLSFSLCLSNFLSVFLSHFPSNRPVPWNQNRKVCMSSFATSKILITGPISISKLTASTVTRFFNIGDKKRHIDSSKSIFTISTWNDAIASYSKKMMQSLERRTFYFSPSMAASLRNCKCLGRKHNFLREQLVLQTLLIELFRVVKFMER